MRHGCEGVGVKGGVMVELGNLLLIIYELHYLTMTIYSDLNVNTFLESYLLVDTLFLVEYYLTL